MDSPRYYVNGAPRYGTLQEVLVDALTFSDNYGQRSQIQQPSADDAPGSDGRVIASFDSEVAREILAMMRAGR